MPDIQARQSKYCQGIAQIVQAHGHVSNADLLEELRKLYPNVSATTVHRASARLVSRHELGLAPAGLDGARRFDANLTPHDHFMCGRCGRLRDIDVAKELSGLLTTKLEGCQVSGRLTISGTCKECRAQTSK